MNIRFVNLWDTLANSIWEWSERFCQLVQSSAKSENHYLLGYSLGGRLAWHALVAKPDLWTGAIIVSADVGITIRQKKKQCLRRDRIWANRFLTEPWDDLLAEWDNLPVFCHRPCPTPRLEADFDRQKIARAFEVYSKGRMDDLRSQITNLPIPITYVTGDADHRYQQIGTELTAQSSNIRHVSIQNAGHRVPWEQPDAFLDILTDVLA
ncbi:MAG: alpha/beta fold hydrolase [Cyanobacteria bacterium J06633_23]